MLKGEKAAAAANNSAYAKSKTAEYKGLDGRTYVLEEKMPETEPDFKDFYKRMGRGFPSLLEVYRCEHYLSGKGLYQKKYVSPKDKEAILSELELSFNRTMQRYTAAHDVVWEYFLGKYPEKIEQERITSYGELVYRATHRR